MGRREPGEGSGQMAAMSEMAPVAGAEGVRGLAAVFGEPPWLAELRVAAWAKLLEMPAPDRATHLWRYSDPQWFELEPALASASAAAAAIATSAAAPRATAATASAVAGHGASPRVVASGPAARVGRGLPGHLESALQRGELSATAVVDGARCAVVLGEAARQAGVVVVDLHAAARDRTQADRVRAHLTRLVGAAHGRAEARNTALWEGGVFVYVPRGVELAGPIHVVLHGDEGAQLRAPRLLMILDDGAAATLIEEQLGDEAGTAGTAGTAGVATAAGTTGAAGTAGVATAAGTTSAAGTAGVATAAGTTSAAGRITSDSADSSLAYQAVTEIVAGSGSRLRYVLTQRLGATAVSHSTQRIELGRDATVLILLTSFGAKSSKVDIGVLLGSQGARSEMFGFLFGSGRQHFDHHTEVRHTAPHTNSNLNFKTVLTGKGRSAYTGLIRIEHGAPYSEAYQENRNLLLSEHARAESIPELEIQIDEVQCKHGATVGPVSREELFYLMSRGIPRDEAVRQIVAGFLEPTLARVPEELAAPLRREVERRLAGL